ncbi:transposase, partial [Emericellopsis cladophorae]
PSVQQSSFLSHIYWDIITITPVGYNGAKFLLHLIDYHTNYHWVKSVAAKSEAATKIKDWTAAVENTSGGFKVQVFHYDNAPEFLIDSLVNWAKAKGIIVKTGAPYVSAHQGKVERAGRTLMDSARADCIDADIPQHLWPLAIEHAAYITNHMPTAANDDSEPPIKKMFDIIGLNYQYDLRAIRTWGCTAYVRIPKERRKASEKLAPRAWKGRLVGIEGVHARIFKIWIPSLKRIVRARDARFIEFTPSTRDIEDFEFEATLVDPEIVEEGRMVFTNEDIHTSEPTTHPVPEESPQGEDHTPQADSQTNDVTPRLSTKTSPKDREPCAPMTPEPTPAADSDPDEDEIARMLEDQLLANPPDQQDDHDNGPRMPGAFDEEKAPLRRSGRRTERVDYKQLHTTGKRRGFMAIDLYRDRDVEVPGLRMFCLSAIKAGQISLLASTDMPKNWHQAIKRSDYDKVIRPAEQRELDAMALRGVFTMVNRPKSPVIPTRWVYTKKTPVDAEPFIKARLVARGDMERGEHYALITVYAAVAHMVSVRIFCTYVAIIDDEWFQVDFVTAFLHAGAKRPIFIEQPQGHSDGTDRVLRVNQAIYGLREAPLWWFECLTKELKKLGFKPLDTELCIFIRDDGVKLLVYVDDMIIAAPHKSLIEEVLVALEGIFNMKRIGEVKQFLGLQFTRNRNNRTIFIHQTTYTEGLMAKFADPGIHSAQTPWPPKTTLPSNWKSLPNIMQPKQWLKRTGSLNWLSIGTRPDIAYTVNKLCEANNGPKEVHGTIFKHLSRYLNGTKNMGITLGGKYDPRDLKLRVFADASFADDPCDRISTAGFVVYLANGPVMWKSKKQSLVTLSSTEAEFINLTPAGQAAIWVRDVLHDLGAAQQVTPML